jgi:hypothetical protein
MTVTGFDWAPTFVKEADSKSTVPNNKRAKRWPSPKNPRQENNRHSDLNVGTTENGNLALSGL